MISQLRLSAGDGKNVLQIFRRSKPTLAVSSEAVKDYQAIPSPPGWPVIGHLFALMKNQARLDKFAAELQVKYGDIVRLFSPSGMGNGHMVMIFNPEDMKSMYAHEERIPKQPGGICIDMVGPKLCLKTCRL